MPLISPTWRSNATSSKAFCIWPGPKKPRSPPFWEEEHSLKENAAYANYDGSLTTVYLIYLIPSTASSFVRVTTFPVRLTFGFLDPLCFKRIWLATTPYGTSKSSNSTSNFNVALGGITPPAPLSPYAYSGGHVRVALPPFLSWQIPSSHPLIT